VTCYFEGEPYPPLFFEKEIRIVQTELLNNRLTESAPDDDSLVEMDYIIGTGTHKHNYENGNQNKSSPPPYFPDMLDTAKQVINKKNKDIIVTDHISQSNSSAKEKFLRKKIH
jgi:hypothetical protein